MKITAICSARVACAALIASVAPFARSFDSAAWLSDAVARAAPDAAAWQIAKPMVQLVDENYFMVAPNQTVLAGRRFLESIAAEKDRDDVLRFVLLHEFRHIQQLQRNEVGSRAVLECNADFHAAFRLSSTTLDIAPDFDAAVSKVIAFQSIGPRLNRMAETDGHEHLTSDQRLLVGAFAGWRAIHQWMVRKGKLNEPRYAELAQRAKSFAEPASADDTSWAASFCGALVMGAKSERNRINFRARPSELVEEGGRALFKVSYELKNTAEWPLQVMGWQVIGIRNKDREEDLSLHMAGQANSISLLLQPGESKTVTWLQMFPRASSGMVWFEWSQPFMPQMVLAATRAGPRVEPPNCQASWSVPADRSLAELFDLILRAGNSASRKFVGIRGEPRADPFTSPWQFYDFTALPSRVNKGQSFIAVRRSGAESSASIGLLETESLAEAENLYNEVADAFEGACGAKVIARGRDKDGDLRLRVDRLTPLSSATMYVTKRDARSSGRPLYTVGWRVQPIDE